MGADILLVGGERLAWGQSWPGDREGSLLVMDYRHLLSSCCLPGPDPWSGRRSGGWALGFPSRGQGARARSPPVSEDTAPGRSPPLLPRLSPATESENLCVQLSCPQPLGPVPHPGQASAARPRPLPLLSPALSLPLQWDPSRHQMGQPGLTLLATGGGGQLFSHSRSAPPKALETMPSQPRLGMLMRTGDQG